MRNRVIDFCFGASDLILLFFAGALVATNWLFPVILVAIAVLMRAAKTFFWHRFDIDVLIGVFQVIHEFLGFDKQEDVRFRLYVRELFSKRNWRCIAWYPENAKPWKIVQPESFGIVGLCARESEFLLEVPKHQQDGGDYADYLVNRWTFTRDEARRATQDRAAYMVEPLMQGETLVGILFMDTKQEKAFTPTTIDVIHVLSPILSKSVIYSLGKE